MSDLVIRFSESERALRSSGEIPGVVTFSYPDNHPTLTIDYAYEPESTPTGTTIATMNEDGLPATATAVSIEDVVKGCIGADELRHLYAIGCQALRDSVPIFCAAQEFEPLREAVTYVEELAAAIDKRLEAES